MQAPTVRWTERTRNLVLGALVAGTVLLCYGPSLKGGLLWDDDFHITKPELRSWAGLGRIWSDLHATKQYYPILHSAFWLEHRLWGDAMVGYHLASVLLHAASCCLLAMVVRRLWSLGTGPGLPVGADWLAAFILAVHPVCVESVAWLSEQKNTLSLVFYLLAALAFLKFHASRAPAAYAGAFLAFLLALLSKSVTATLPAALLVALWWRLGRLSLRRDILPLVPWFVAALASGLLTSWIERTLIGAKGPAFALSAGQRLLLASRIVWFYLGKLLWPTHLAFTYPRWNVPEQAAGWFGCLAGLLAVTAALWLLRRRTRGPLAGWLLFTGSLFPVLGFINVYPFIFSYVADHFQYLACAVACAGGAGAVASLLARGRPLARRTGWCAVAALLLVLAVRARSECEAYRDSETLYRETLRRSPGSWMAHDNLGQIEMKRGLVDIAIDHYRKAIDLFPDYAGTHDNLGVALLRKGQVAEATAQLEVAAQLDPLDPMPHDNLGLAFRREGRMQDALRQFQAALGINPDDNSARFNLAQTLVRLGRPEEAIAEYAKILAGDPGNLEARLRLGSLLQRTGRTDEAVNQFRRAVQDQPGNADAENDLGAALLAGGQAEAAIDYFRKALQVRPGSLDAWINLGNALLRLGRFDESIGAFEKALSIDPDDPETQRALQVARYQKAARNGP
ncbi:MAG TPA: tetratricopeptide repeat protein [Opitutaceae bacterium]|jgi:tetratricopeptide (TPR) repeat protein